MLTALLIDGGHLRVCFRIAGKDYTAENIAEFARKCFSENEEVYRIFYYDAPKYEGEIRAPVSGESRTFRNEDPLLVNLGRMDNFAIRRGRLKFSGWKIKKEFMRRIKDGSFTGPFEDRHFAPEFQQKGVDMALGLDVAAIAETNKVGQFILISADTDMAPALKHGRMRGMRAIVVKPGHIRINKLHDVLYVHSDLVRLVEI